ncbi:MAG: FmdB family zinc ribbon protein [Chloroflexota bacterium]|jgi:putative FmdB family regulatory protein
MPIYEYRCADCGHVTSILVRTIGGEYTPKCEDCGSASMTRNVSRPGLIRSRNGNTQTGLLQPVNPREAIRRMGDMYNSSGSDPGRGFNEVVRRVEAGDSPNELKEAISEARRNETRSSQS